MSWGLPRASAQAVGDDKKPATQAATQPTIPPLEAPKGFVKVEAAGFTFMVTDSEGIEKAFENALKDYKAPEKPAYSPDILHDKVKDKVDDIVKTIADHMGVEPTDEMKKVFTDEVLPALADSRDSVALNYQLICTKEQLIKMVKEGWGKNQFYFNRQLNDVTWRPQVQLGKAEDPVYLARPIILPQDMEWAEQKKVLYKALSDYTKQADARLASRSLTYIQLGSIKAATIAVEDFEPKDNQAWLKVGTTALVGSIVAAETIEIDPRQLLFPIMRDPDRTVVFAHQIDLAFPTDLKDVIPAARPLYQGAHHRRSTRVMYRLAAMHGLEITGKIMKRVMTDKPDDLDKTLDIVNEAIGGDEAKRKELGVLLRARRAPLPLPDFKFDNGDEETGDEKSGDEKPGDEKPAK